MSRLVKLQLRNVFHSKLLYICLSILLFMGPIIEFIFTMFSNSGIQAFPAMIEAVSNVGTVEIIFLALFFCLDFNEGTTKNIIARGYTRAQLLISKYICGFIGLMAMYLVLMIVTFVLFIKDGIGFDINLLIQLGFSLVNIMAYVIYYGTISFLLEKNGSAIIACLIGPSIIALFLSIVDNRVGIEISKYWFDNISAIFIDNPTVLNWSITTIYYGLYSILFIALGIFLLKKREIK